MSLESTTYIDGLDPANPPGSDPLAQADDHLRLIKSALKATFPNITGPVTVSQDELNAITSGEGGAGTIAVPNDIYFTNAGTFYVDNVKALELTNQKAYLFAGSTRNPHLGTTPGLAIEYNANTNKNFLAVGIPPTVSGPGLGGVVLNMIGKPGNLMAFHSNGGTVGSIYTNMTSTSYLTSSDYRLKKDVKPMTGALEKILKVKPVTYTWNTDQSKGEGFIAHELQEVFPLAVTGEKDAVWEDGTARYQGIDTSFLVAAVISAMQEQQKQIDSLKAELAALKSN